MSKVNFAGYKLKVPGHPLLRMLAGVALVIGGTLGFLPVLGFWMIPLGLAVLAVDFPAAERAYHWLERKWKPVEDRVRQWWRGARARE